MCVYVVSEATILLGHVPRHFPTTDAPFLMSCYTDVFPGQEPPSTHSFPYKSCLIFCFLFLFVLIPTVCFTAFTRQRSRPAQSPFDIRSMSRRKMERRRREKRAWTGQVVGRVAEPAPHIHMALMEGPSFLCQRQQEELDFCLFFQRYPGLQLVCGGQKRGQKEEEREYVRSKLDGSSRIMIPRLISSSRGGVDIRSIIELHRYASGQMLLEPTSPFSPVCLNQVCV